MNCQKEDDSLSDPNQKQEINQEVKATTKTVSAADIPEIMNLIKSKSNSKLEFDFGGQENYAAAPSGGESHETNLTITQVMTDEIMASTLNGITNYAFQMTTNSNDYILNLVVKEWYGVNVIYFSKYVPSTNLTTIDFTNFTGDIYYYDETGAYQAKVAMIGGASSSHITYDAPCPDSDGDPIDPDGNDGSGSGSGGSSGGGGDCYFEVVVSITECGGDNSGTIHPPAGTGTADDCGADSGIGGIATTTFTWTCNNSQSAPPPEEIFFDPPCSNNGSGGSGGLPDTNSCPGVTPCTDELQSFDENCVCTFNFNPVTPINTNTICDKKNLVSSFNSPFNVNLNSVSDCNDEITTPEDEKFMCIYNKLTNSPSFKNLFIDTFGESEDLNVEFKVVDNIPPVPPSTTEPNGVTKSISVTVDSNTGAIVDFDLEILINRGYMNSSSAISIAKTILHESIHAYLSLKHLNCNLGTPIDELIEDLNSMSFEELLNSYYAASCPNQEQHEFMFDYMIPVMSTILADIKDSLVPENHQNIAEEVTFVDELNPSGPEVPWNWNQFYKYLSMSGLQNTDAFQFEMLPITSPKYENFGKYAISYGKESFSKNCVD